MNAPPDFEGWADERYALPGVSSLLIEFQDKFGLSVNILLWCGWCAETFEEAPALPFQKAIEVAGEWSGHVTARLRAARRFLKPAPPDVEREAAEALRRDILALELAAERVEQAMLAKLARSTLTPARERAGAPARARKYLKQYIAAASASATEEFSTSLLDELVLHIFPYADHAQCAPR